MTVSGIGIQQILPRSGTGWQGSNPAANRRDDAEEDGSRSGVVRRSPPAPGTGKIIDKSV